MVLSDPEAEEESDDYNDFDVVAEVFKQFVNSGETIMDSYVIGAISDGTLIFGASFGGPGADET